MPELPEAETIARGLDGLIRGRKLVRMRCLTAGICERTGKYPVGARVAAVTRRGKKVLVHFGDGATLLVSLGMSGQLRRRPDGPLPKHTHIVLNFDRVDLIYVDPRRLGRLVPSRVATTMLAPAARVASWCDERLGPDATAVSWPEFRERMGRRRGAFKPLLLNQRVLAGVGNIYADEILHRAGVHPRTPPASLAPAALRRVYRSTKSILRKAVEAGGTTFRDYVTPTGASGDFGGFLAVYGREGERCRKCGAAIRRLSWPAGRSTYYCPRCQPGPERK
ncbi:MAG TPA: bifunctional DNA-formamidopyrimidine glycosylase/DNA-(apurinic or apyrimidinic site) lyase [bacterium]|nr:bifunctional DNA-formamidopyrimidine glycosylase/DNA-(apurinic or apyrimidinic site) lyase [bacterium]